MADEKKPAQRLGGLSSGPGAGRLGSLRSGDGAGPSTTAAPSSGAGGGARKMRFMPTNFSRPKARADSTSEGVPSTSVSVASKSESAFDDLMKAAQAEAIWQRQRGGRGGLAGRGAGRAMTTFGGGAGGPDAAGGGASSGGHRVWGGGGGGIAGRGAGGAGRRRLVKAEGGVKAEPGAEGEAKLGGIAEGREGSGSEDEGAGSDAELEEEEDPLSYDQYYPAMLPHREEGEPLLREPDDPTKVIPKDLFDLPEDYRPMLEELSFLQDVERNDGRLMLFQLPSLLPIAAAAGGPDGAGTSVAASRPASLREVPSSRIGKLLVFQSGKVKMQIGDVLLDADPGIPPRFRQDLAVVSAQSKRCVMLAPVALRMVCSPNLETLLEPEQPLPAWQRGTAAAAAGDGMEEDGGMEEASKGVAAGAGVAGRRAVVVDDSSSEEEAEAMEVDGAAPAAKAARGAPAANGAQQQQQQQQQQPLSPRQRRGKQAATAAAPQRVAVKKEEAAAGEEEEVVSPRRGGGLRSPRGVRRAAGGGGGGGEAR